MPKFFKLTTSRWSRAGTQSFVHGEHFLQVEHFDRTPPIAGPSSWPPLLVGLVVIGALLIAAALK